MNKNYERGIRFERERIMFHKARKAALVFRTAGSHSAIDVGAVYSAPEKDYIQTGILGRIVLEQCEVTRNKTRKRKLPFTNGVYWVEFRTETKIIPNTKRSNKK